jgi:hypothetical protein
MIGGGPCLPPPPGRGLEVAPEPAYIHCSWNVNNDQFCPHDRPEACRTKCEGVCVGLCWVGYRVRLSGDRRARAEWVTKKCRLSWLTNSALVYEPKSGGRGSCGVLANEYSCAHGAQINFGDLTPFLTWVGRLLHKGNPRDLLVGLLCPSHLRGG